MPELPEVEHVRRTLLPLLSQRRIVNTTVRLAKQVWRPKGDAAGFSHRLRGAVIEDILRRGKYLIIILSGGQYLVAHLRMTGKLLFKDASAEPDVYTHIVFRLDDGHQLFYHDVRQFGGMALWDSDPFIEPPLCDLGVEPLSDAFTCSYLWPILRRKHTSIKSVLLDQHIIAGIGNIYADEALFAAGIRPRKRANRLTKRECGALIQAIRSILAAAVAAGGSSVRDYRDGLGSSGSYQFHHAVYGRSGQPCKKCGTVLKQVRVAGRTSVYCPTCQKS